MNEFPQLFPAHHLSPEWTPISDVAARAGRTRMTRLIGWVVIALAVFRLLVAPWTELLPEEAYYWMYWQHPAAGYFDHPPMVAWVIGAGTALFGTGEFGVRFVTILLSTASAGLVFLLGRKWVGACAGLWAALAYSLLPVFAGAAFIVTPDQALIFFWLAALCAFSQAVYTERWIWWLAAGAAFGFALLSKYYAVMLGPSLLLFLAGSPRHRRWLCRPQPWVACALALAVFSPVVFWNAEHGWASFLFQAGRTQTDTPHALRNVFRFWVVQAGILTPLVLVWFGVAVVRGVHAVRDRRDEVWAFALCFSLPLFLVFLAASFKTEVHVNWTAPAFLSLLPATAALTMRRWNAAGPTWKYAVVASGALCVAAIIGASASLARGAPTVYEQAGGWRALAGDVKSLQGELAKETGLTPFIIGADKYDLAAEMAFYLREPFDTVNNYALGGRGLSFRYWVPLEAWEGRPAVAIMEEPQRSTLRKLRGHFAKVEAPQRVVADGPGFHQRVSYLVKCYGYQVRHN